MSLEGLFNPPAELPTPRQSTFMAKFTGYFQHRI